MSARKLPVKLEKEPLIDVICGLSFTSTMAAESLLPGLIFSKLAPKNPALEALPASQLPAAVRENDPNLRNAALMKVVLDEKFAVLIGSKWMGVGCIMPYAGWAEFKGMIERVFAILPDAPFISKIDSFSLRYVDLIEDVEKACSLDQLNVEITIAGRSIKAQPTQFRTEIAEDSFVHAVTIVSPATIQQNAGAQRQGVLVDVDTHRIGSMDVPDFLGKMSSLLEEIHGSNKSLFFDLLSEIGLNKLIPKYV